MRPDTPCRYEQESAKATGDTTAIGLLYERIGGTYEELNQLDESIVYYHKALQNAKQKQGDMHIAANAWHISKILIKQQKAQQALGFFRAKIPSALYKDEATTAFVLTGLAECYVALHSYKKAEQYYVQLLSISNKSSDDAQRFTTYTSAGSFYLLNKKYDKARVYLNKALDLSGRVGSLVRTADIHLLLFRLDSSQAHFPVAIAHYQRYKALNDSVFTADKIKVIASLEIQYDTRKKEQNIVVLTKQNQIQQAGLREREVQRNSLLGGRCC